MGSKNMVTDPFKFASLHATAILMDGASNHLLLPSLTCHMLFAHASRPHRPLTNARQVSCPLNDTGFTSHAPCLCSMHILSSYRFVYTARPLRLSPVGSKKPLMRAALGPVAPLMPMRNAPALSLATACASAAA